MSRQLSAAVGGRRSWPEEERRRLLLVMGGGAALARLSTEDLWARYLNTLGTKPRAPLAERLRAYAPEYPAKWAALKLPQ